MRQVIAIAACLWFAACAPGVYHAGPALAPPALNGTELIAADGTSLPLRHWQATAVNPRAVVIAVHGFNDYSNAFAQPGTVLANAGIQVYAYDQRGFGATNLAGYWAGVETMVDDLVQMVATVRARHPDVPLYLLGESMGGAVVMTALAHRRLPNVAGAVLIAPAVWGRETMNPFYRAALWLGAHTVPWLSVTGRGLKITPSDNIEMLRALSADPLVIKETRIEAIYGVVNMMDAALAAAPHIDAPLLVLYGARDEIIPKAPTARMLDRLNGHHRVAVYPDGYHMLTRDLQADRVLTDIAAWIEAPRAPLPSGFDKNWMAFLDQK